MPLEPAEPDFEKFAGISIPTCGFSRQRWIVSTYPYARYYRRKKVSGWDEEGSDTKPAAPLKPSVLDRLAMRLFDRRRGSVRNDQRYQLAPGFVAQADPGGLSTGNRPRSQGKAGFLTRAESQLFLGLLCHKDAVFLMPKF